jgi:hypothetical protein
MSARRDDKIGYVTPNQEKLTIEYQDKEHHDTSLEHFEPQSIKSSNKRKSIASLNGGLK